MVQESEECREEPSLIAYFREIMIILFLCLLVGAVLYCWRSYVKSKEQRRPPRSQARVASSE